MDYLTYLKTPEWQAKRAERLRIDQFKCQKCGRPMDLQVHHLNYENIGHEDVYNDLITLCKYCHKKIEDEKKEYKLAYQHNYRSDYICDRRIELRFCKDYHHRDLSQGGDLNMTNRDVIKAEWCKWLALNNLADRKIRVTTVLDYFRDIRIELILKMSEAGAPPDAILAKGISQNMVRKYYCNRDSANNVMKRHKEEMKEYAETE